MGQRRRKPPVQKGNRPKSKSNTSCAISSHCSITHGWTILPEFRHAVLNPHTRTVSNLVSESNQSIEGLPRCRRSLPKTLPSPIIAS